MADILSVIQQFLCYGSQPCIQEFNQYAYKPAEGIFYAVFFPIVVILLFVYIVSGAVGALKAKGFRILIGVAFFAFIILQGWYYFFILASKLWFLVLFLLGILWFGVHTFTGREGGGGGGAHARAMGGGEGNSKVINFLQDTTGRIINPVEAKKLHNMLDRDLKILRGNRDTLEKRAKSVKEQNAAKEVYDEIAHVDRSISTLTGFKSAGAYADYKRWKGIEGSQIKPM
jgi:hypothetical protein